MELRDLQIVNIQSPFNPDQRINIPAGLSVNRDPGRFAGIDVGKGDLVENAHGAVVTIAGQSDAVLEKGAVDVADVDPTHRIPSGKKPGGTVAVAAEDPVDLDVLDGATPAFIGVQCHHIIVASSHQIADPPVAAAAVQMDPVHVGGVGFTVVEIEGDVVYSELLHIGKGCGKDRGVF